MNTHPAFDYNQKVIVAVEFGIEPTKLPVDGLNHSIFQRMDIPTIEQAFKKEVNHLIRLLISRKFSKVVDERMSYWETRIPAGQCAYVHYFIGQPADIENAYAKLKELPFVMISLSHIEPQVSSSPYSFPDGVAPSFFYLGDKKPYTEKSLYWFNFFPEQPYLFERTFWGWAHFQISRLKEGGDCNQLTTVDSKDKLKVHNIEPFISVNLNRFASFKGFFLAAREAGQHSFTHDQDYKWYGMLLKKIN